MSFLETLSGTDTSLGAGHPSHFGGASYQTFLDDINSWQIQQGG